MSYEISHIPEIVKTNGILTCKKYIGYVLTVVC